MKKIIGITRGRVENGHETFFNSRTITITWDLRGTRKIDRHKSDSQT